MEAPVIMASFSAPISKPSLPNRLIFNFPANRKPAVLVGNLPGYFTFRAKTAINSTNINMFLTEETTTSESLYSLLGVSEAATLSEIKKAYKQLVLKYHPDVSPPECSQEITRMFIRIKEAYETLSDPITRALYDKDFTNGFPPPFPAQKLYRSYRPAMDKSGDWKRRWQVQLEELERKSRNKELKR